MKNFGHGVFAGEPVINAAKAVFDSSKPGATCEASSHVNETSKCDEVFTSSARAWVPKRASLDSWIKVRRLRDDLYRMDLISFFQFRIVYVYFLCLLKWHFAQKILIIRSKKHV